MSNNLFGIDVSKPAVELTHEIDTPDYKRRKSKKIDYDKDLSKKDMHLDDETKAMFLPNEQSVNSNYSKDVPIHNLDSSILIDDSLTNLTKDSGKELE